MTEIIDRSKKFLTDAKKKIEIFWLATKRSPYSLVSMIFNMMKEKGIQITS
jgi:hypothetical protein